MEKPKDINVKKEEDMTLDDYLTDEDLGRSSQITISLTTLIKIILFGAMLMIVLLLSLISIIQNNETIIDKPNKEIVYTDDV